MASRLKTLAQKKKSWQGQGSLQSNPWFHCGVESLEPRMMLSSVVWTGGGSNHAWSNPANWSSNPSLPGPDDDISIGPGYAVLADISATIDSCAGPAISWVTDLRS